MNTPKSFERVARDYDALRGGMDRGRQSAGAVAPHLVPGGPTLEVGVGTGAVAAGLLERGHTVYGVDISPSMLRQAGERIGGRLARADARALPCPDGAFANVVCVHVLHLVGDMGAALAEARRVLRTGGRLVAVHGDPFADDDPMVAALERLAPLRPERPDSPGRLVEAAAAVGLRAVQQGPDAAYVQATSPEQLATSLEKRVPPYLWEVTDDDWRRLVVPVIEALRTLPEPERPREQVWRSWLTVLRK
ncbi:class I SAM-dependent methyltransferase [Streptomyces sp. JHA26]|uniref:class I SAM-dependent methyltransferase n=1 Tax=Streptomyces sp. JHA26 TaxID=1917143 RepID=UPI00098A31B0|nr:class I SAM-dependent methyltransferase [Streptomyces sp. JHA26]